MPRSLAFTLLVMLLYSPRSVHFVGGSQYVNVALGKPALDTDNHFEASFSGLPDLAVDGNKNPYYYSGSCSHTFSKTDNFWVVDLLHSYPIHHIGITNRDDLGYRLTDFYIYASEKNPLPIPPKDGAFVGELCLRHPSAVPLAGPHYFYCSSNNTKGRYVYLWKPANNFLTLCEFEVFVEEAYLNVLWSPVGFTVSPGKKSSVDAFASPRLERFTAMDCVTACMSVGRERWYATVVQVNSASMTCECIQQSGLDSPGAVVAHGDWILLEAVGI